MTVKIRLPYSLIMHVCEQEVITTSMNKKLKKLTAILLTVCLAFALCACSSGGSGTSQGTGQTTEAVQETVPAADHQAQQAETAAQTAEAGAKLQCCRSCVLLFLRPLQHLLPHLIQHHPLNSQRRSIIWLW